MSNHPLGPWTETQGSLYYGPFGAIYLKSPGGSFVKTQDLFADLQVGKLTSRSGVNTKKPYRPQSYALTSEVRAPVGVSCTVRSSVDGTEMKHINVPPSNYPALEPGGQGAVESTALDKAKSKLVASSMATMQAIASAVEAPKSLDSILNLAKLATGGHNKAIGNLAKNLAASKSGSRAQLVKAIADSWLEYSFGIVPIVLDAENAYQAYLESLVETPPQPFKTRESFSWNTKGSKQSVQSTGWLKIDVTSTLEQRASASVGGRYLISSTAPSTLSRVRKSFGLDFESLLPTAYELLPYSWLFDYVSNLGDIVNAVSKHSAVLDTCWSTVLYEESVEYILSNVRGYTPSVSVIEGGGTSTSYRKLTKFTRGTFNLDSFVPDFRFEAPNFRQTATLAAFVASSILRPPRLTLPPGTLRAASSIIRGR